MNRPSIERLVPLCQLPPGAEAKVRELKGEAGFRQRARELGFGEDATVKKIGGAGPFVCLVNGARIALGHSVAMQIIVARQLMA